MLNAGGAKKNDYFLISLKVYKDKLLSYINNREILYRMSFKKVFGRNELCEVVDLSALKHIVKNWDRYESLIVKNDENDYDYNPKNICQKYLENLEYFHIL